MPRNVAIGVQTITIRSVSALGNNLGTCLIANAALLTHFGLLGGDHPTTLGCNLSLMACFVDINVSQSSVATYARRGGMFNIHLTANLLRNLPVEKICKSVKI